MFASLTHSLTHSLTPNNERVVYTSTHTRRGRYRWAERSVISAPLLRDDRSDYLGFISVHDILSALIMHMFPPGPCGYAATTEAPEWFLLDASPESVKRILGMVMEKGESFCNRTVGSIRRGPKGGDGSWMLDGRDCAVNVQNDDPTLLDVIQRHFLPESRVSLGSGTGTATTYPPLNHRVAVYRQGHVHSIHTHAYSYSLSSRRLMYVGLPTFEKRKKEGANVLVV